MNWVKRTIRNIKKLIIFLPVVWETEDWDYTYGVELFIKRSVKPTHQNVGGM